MAGPPGGHVAPPGNSARAAVVHPGMSDCVILTRFWDEYPLDTVVAEVDERFEVGPFRGRLEPAAAADEAQAVLLCYTGDGPSALLAVPRNGASWVERGPVAYRVERTSLAPPAWRRLRPDLGVVLGTGFALAVVASILSWSALSPPELRETDERGSALSIRPAAIKRGVGPERPAPARGTTPRLSVRPGEVVE